MAGVSLPGRGESAASAAVPAAVLPGAKNLRVFGNSERFRAGRLGLPEDQKSRGSVR